MRIVPEPPGFESGRVRLSLLPGIPLNKHYAVQQLDKQRSKACCYNIYRGLQRPRRHISFIGE